MNPQPQPPTLRPRALVTELFALALDRQAAAEDALRSLATAGDGLAAGALEAVVVVEIDARFRHDPEGRDLPPASLDTLDRVLRAIDHAHQPGTGPG